MPQTRGHHRWTPAQEAALHTVVTDHLDLDVIDIVRLLPEDVQELGYWSIKAKVNRTYGSRAERREKHHSRRQGDAIAAARPDLAVVESTFREQGLLDWRKVNSLIREMKETVDAALPQFDYLQYGWPEATEPVAIMGIGDTHMLSWATDTLLLERVIDQWLGVPGLHGIWLGDTADMPIKMRSVKEVQGVALGSEAAGAYVRAIWAELSARTVAACWGNHDAERLEKQAGWNMFADFARKWFTYFDHIGHIDIRVGKQLYKFAVSHKFQGRSYMNAVHGLQRYMRMVGQDREIAMAGDSHEPGVFHYSDGTIQRLAMNCGSFQNSGYGRRYYELHNDPAMPVVLLFPDEHRFVGFKNIDDYLASTQRKRAA